MPRRGGALAGLRAAARPPASRRLLGWVSIAVATACHTPRPRPIALWTEQCAHCHMTISDPRFTAELVTRSGKVFGFDDPACLALFLQEGVVPPAQVHSLWVADFLHPDRWLDARRAVFLRRADLPTPMASGLAAFASRAEADSVGEASGGVLLDWDEVARAPVPHRGGPGHHPSSPSGPDA